MKTRQIEYINEAVLVLKHFIELSVDLLPILYSLKQINNPTLEECNNINKIQEVYERYDFNKDTSRILIGSDILNLIQKSFVKMKNENSKRSNLTRKNLYAFLKEYKRLKHNWDLTVVN